jgi:xylulokinase
MEHFGLDERLLPEVRPTFSVQGRLTKDAAAELGLAPGVPVAYRAGDQPNNAFSLNVLDPGEAAATAGTSGVVYGVLDQPVHDPGSRVNSFIHVTHAPGRTRFGVLLCINGTGILNSWLRKNVSGGAPYAQLNAEAAKVPVGSDGLVVIPFGNGAERMLGNRNVGARIAGLNLNRHSRAHLLRASQEGIAFSFRYGMEIMHSMGVDTARIRAGETNMFLSPVFRETLADCTGSVIELYDTDGAQGAARGGAIGAGIYSSEKDAFASLRRTGEARPSARGRSDADEAYGRWLAELVRPD